MGADPVSLFGWMAGTSVGEALKSQREAEMVERRRSEGDVVFYVPADLTAFKPDGVGLQEGKVN